MGSGCHIVFMGDHHQGDSLLVQFIKQFQHFSRGVRVEGAGGLVRQEKTRAIDDGSRDGDPLLLAAGELVGTIVQSLTQADAIQG